MLDQDFITIENRRFRLSSIHSYREGNNVGERYYLIIDCGNKIEEIGVNHQSDIRYYLTRLDNVV